MKDAQDAQDAKSSASDAAAAAGLASPSRGKRRAAGESTQNLQELDADEAAMLEGEEEDAAVPKATTLLKQPTIISGGQMRDYQLEGLNWMIRLMENGINGILADEMGLGKTLQSISIIAYLHQHLNIKGPHLIMVPKSTLSNWMNEFKRFCPSIRTLRFHGSKEEREEIVNSRLKHAKAASDTDRDWDVVVTTYEVVNLEKNILTKIHWKVCLCDRGKVCVYVCVRESGL